MIVVTLYTTEGCHLCRDALQILQKLRTGFELKIDAVEIGDDDELTAKYGIRIPVLEFSDSSELDWPFTSKDVVQKINNMR